MTILSVIAIMLIMKKKKKENKVGITNLADALVHNPISNKIEETRDGFLSFMSKYSILTIAIGTIIGNAFKDLTNSLTNDIIVPLINIIVSYIPITEHLIGYQIEINGITIKLGSFLSVTFNTLLIAAVIYLLFAVVLNKKEILEKK